MSNLTDVILLLYQYQDADTDKLAGKITERRRAVWINTMRDLARQHGCNQLPKTPKGSDAKELARLSREDAQSIAKTFNQDVKRQIERIYSANPRSNRNAYYRQLEQWTKKRAVWKNMSVGLNTDGSTRYFATKRFYEQNPQLSRMFVASGVPPTCKICVRIFAAGVVDLKYVNSHPLPAHINCPHYYKNASPTIAECGKLWVG